MVPGLMLMVCVLHYILAVQVILYESTSYNHGFGAKQPDHCLSYPESLRDAGLLAYTPGELVGDSDYNYYNYLSIDWDSVVKNGEMTQNGEVTVELTLKLDGLDGNDGLGDLDLANTYVAALRDETMSVTEVCIDLQDRGLIDDYEEHLNRINDGNLCETDTLLYFEMWWDPILKLFHLRRSGALISRTIFRILYSTFAPVFSSALLGSVGEIFKERSPMFYFFLYILSVFSVYAPVFWHLCSPP